MARFLTIDEVVAEASSALPKATDEERVLMRQWAFRTQYQIGFSKYNIMKSDKIYLTTEFAIAKPDDLARTIDISLFNSLDQEIRINYRGWGKSSDLDERTAQIHTDLRSIVTTLRVSEDADFFYVQDYTTDDVCSDYAYIKYYGLPTDDSTPPLPLIPQESAMACIMYVRWMLSIRRNESIGMQRMLAQDYKLASASARTRLKTPDPIMARVINKKANSLIQKLELEDRRY